MSNERSHLHACLRGRARGRIRRRQRRTAQDNTFELKLAHWVPPSHPLQKALEDWGSSVEKASGGTIKYKVYPSQQLGKAFDHYDMARDGIADLTYINPGYQPGRFPIIGAGELPFLISNAKGGSQALDAWYRKYAAKRDEGRQILPRLHARSRHVPLREEEDRGARRHQGHEDPAGARHHGAHSSRCSAAPTCNASAPEVRDIIEKGVAEAVTFPWGSVPLFGIDKVTKYHIDAPLYATTFAFVFSQRPTTRCRRRRRR